MAESHVISVPVTMHSELDIVKIVRIWIAEKDK